MSKKFGKIITGIAAAAAVGAGVFYWFKKKNEVTEDDFEEEDFEDDFELDDDLEETKETREYVSLTPSADKEAESDKGVSQVSESPSEAAPEEDTTPAEDTDSDEEPVTTE